MNRRTAIAELKACESALRGMGVRGLFLFGSTIRGEAGPDSDIDLFIDHDESGRFSLFDLMDVRDVLEQAIHGPVDLTTRRSLHPVLRDAILAEAERVF